MTRFRTQLNRSVTHIRPRRSLKYQHIFEYRPVSFYAVDYCTDALCIKDVVKIEHTLARGLFYVYWNYGYYIKEPSLMDETKALTVMGDKVNEYLEYLQKYDLDFESTLRETDGTESEKSSEYTKRKSRQYRFVTISNSMDWNFVFLQMEYFNYASRVNNREEFPFVLPLSLDEKKEEDKD